MKLMLNKLRDERILKNAYLADIELGVVPPFTKYAEWLKLYEKKKNK